jgi:hypothetical protein
MGIVRLEPAMMKVLDWTSRMMEWRPTVNRYRVVNGDYFDYPVYPTASRTSCSRLSASVVDEV